MTSKKTLIELIESTLDALRSLAQTDELYRETIAMIVLDTQSALDEIKTADGEVQE